MFDPTCQGKDIGADVCNLWVFKWQTA